MQGIHLIMPMGGSGSRFSEHGFLQPKPLIPLNGKPFFYWATQSIAKFVPLESLTFVVLREHITGFGIDQEILRYYPDARIRVLEHVLNGAVLTCLAGVEDIHDDSPVLFNDCDHSFLCRAFYEYAGAQREERCDGALLTFPSHDPKFSFVRFDESKKAIGTVEKCAVSNQAICGAYYFKSKFVFEAAAKQYLERCTYKEFFVSGVYNIMAEKGAEIRTFSVDMHLPFGTPEEYEAACMYREFGVFE